MKTLFFDKTRKSRFLVVMWAKLFSKMSKSAILSKTAFFDKIDVFWILLGYTTFCCFSAFCDIQGSYLRNVTSRVILMTGWIMDRKRGPKSGESAGKVTHAAKSGPKSGDSWPARKIVEICLFWKNKTAFFKILEKVQKVQKRCFHKSRKSVQKSPSVSRDFGSPTVYIRSGIFDVFTFLQKVVRNFSFFAFFVIFRKMKNRPQPHVSYFMTFCVFVRNDIFKGFPKMLGLGWDPSFCGKMWSILLAQEEKGAGRKTTQKWWQVGFWTKKGSQKVWIRRKKWHIGRKVVQKWSLSGRPWKSMKICLFWKNENGLFKMNKKCKKCKNAVFQKAENRLKNRLLFLGIFEVHNTFI